MCVCIYLYRIVYTYRIYMSPPLLIDQKVLSDPELRLTIIQKLSLSVSSHTYTPNWSNNFYYTSYQQCEPLCPSLPGECPSETGKQSKLPQCTIDV